MNLKTRMRSTFMRRFSSASQQAAQQNKARKQRQRRGEPPVVLYFHQVDDPYSHLAVQKLDQLKARYTLDFVPHLVAAPEAAYQGAAEHFPLWARTDAADVAPYYGTTFTPTIEVPATTAVEQANALLATQLGNDAFARTAIETGTALWSGGAIAPTGNDQAGTDAVRTGTELRRQLGHYQGAMFYFDGEWYWGVDRLRLLEARLIAEGFSKEPDHICVPEPTPTDAHQLNADGITLEYFPSLRSPYTAIGHQRVLDLVARSGAHLHVRPVMPMMMRGVPAPREKGRYIISDAGREGRQHGAPLGKIVDPFGDPVRSAFALFPAAQEAGRPMEFITAYLNAAWFDGVDITTEKGLRQVVVNAGLEWNQVAWISHG